jgi:hypothetical protein
MISREMTDDSQFVLAVAQHLRDELLPKVSGPIKLNKRLRSDEAVVDGWYTIIARYDNIDIVLYFDRFPRFSRRCFFVGF